MGKINATRVILGGLVAGVIIIALDAFWNGVVFDTQWRSFAGPAATISTTGFTTFVAWGLLAGIAACWLYAVARPRLGSGVKTAMMTGFAFWLISYALPTMGQMALATVPRSLLMMSCATSAVGAIVGSVAGAALYKEA